MSPKKIVRKILNLLRRVLPHWVFQLQHYTESRVAQLLYRNPSSKMIIVGIVGSKGKTTTANILWGILNTKDTPAGLIGTADIQIGNQVVKNSWHKTMPGRWHTQKLLRRMLNAGCKYAILEVPSEAQQNWRHIGINFDLIIFTNVTNEILATHKNSLDILHKHNKRLLSKLNSLKRKRINGDKIPKTILANKDAQDFAEYFKFKADQKYSYGVSKKDADFTPKDVKSDLQGSTFELQNQKFKLHIPGSINVSNAIAAISTAKILDLELPQIATRLDAYKGVPGRMNLIGQGQPFTVVIDYAHEESGLQYLVEWAKDSAPKGAKIISLICGQGGGRDIKKRPIMGAIATKYSDSVVISNDDVYDDDPQDIIDDIVAGCKQVRPSLKGIYQIQDRREGIAKALSLAKAGDIVLLTGKGNDPSSIIAGVKIPWDEQKVTEEELAKLGYHKK
jgi:UDP-N-acetylmuramoyl-L-alanyl-D-glutamate--2,6-diaminopimelate ligase